MRASCVEDWTGWEGHSREFAFSAGWFALRLFSRLDLAWVLEKKLKSWLADMVSPASFFLALVPPSGREAVMVRDDFPV